MRLAAWCFLSVLAPVAASDAVVIKAVNALPDAIHVGEKIPGSSCRWLGCVHLTGSGANGGFFGGISGAYLNGTRLLMVSDTTKFHHNPWYGSGRLFSADVKTEAVPANSHLPEGLSRPVGLENVRMALLKDRYGKLLKNDKKHGDTESIDVRWPDTAYVGVERTHLIRRYHVNHLLDSTSQISFGTPTIEGASQTNLQDISGVGAQLQKCTSDGGNNGAEGITLLQHGRILVLCEHNKPGAPKDTTIGWVADEMTGDIVMSLTIKLPVVEGKNGVFYRISGVAPIPDTGDVLILFHFWSPETKNFVKLGRITLPTAQSSSNSQSKEIQPTFVLELKERDGHPMDNFETLVVVKAPAAAAGDYIIHLISDNNFNPAHQRTLMLSLLMEGSGTTGSQEKFSIGQVAEPVRSAPGLRLPTAVLVAAAALAVALASLAAVKMTRSMARKQNGAESTLLTLEGGEPSNDALD